jgi:methenyltetrahydrofolate cyclohydrolase
MKLVELSIKEFIDVVDSNTATPGGGSVAALAVSQGIGLIRMVAHLTVSKKKFLALEQHIQNQYLNAFQQLESYKLQAMGLVDEDTDAFNHIMTAFKMPKDDSDQINARNEAIKQATVGATLIPYQVAQVALNALKITKGMILYANKNAISDLGVGSLMMVSGLEGAVLNVKTNMLGFDDAAMVQEYDFLCDAILKEAGDIHKEIMTFVHKSLNLKQ